MIKHIIFDWSGVINDDCQSDYKAIIATLKHFGGPDMSYGEFRNKWEWPFMNFYEKYSNLKISYEEQKPVFTKYISKFKNPKPYPGSRKVLQGFKKQGIGMIVISGDLKSTLTKEVKNFGMEDLFQEINWQVTDKRAIIKDCIKRNSFKADETVFIGDTDHEILCGKHAGTKTIGVTWGFHKEKRLKKAGADFIAHDFKELEQYIYYDK